MHLSFYTTNPTDQTFVFNTAGIGFQQRPWTRVKRESNPEAFFILSKRNYKVFANLALKVRSPKRIIAILNIGACYSFIRLNEIVQAMRSNVRKLHSARNILNASERPCPLLLPLNLWFRSKRVQKSSLALSQIDSQLPSYLWARFVMWQRSRPAWTSSRWMKDRQCISVDNL